MATALAPPFPPFPLLRTGFLSVALGLPSLALAQSSFTPHAYLGAGLSVLNDGPFDSPAYLSYNTTAGPVLTAGWQFSPRLAVQLSPALAWRGSTGRYIGSQTTNGQNLSTVNYRLGLTRLTVPLLLRVTLTNPAARLRVEAQGGATWLHDRQAYTATETDNSAGTVLTQSRSTAASNSALLTLGPALRYGLGPRLELALALPVHYELRGYQHAFYSSSLSDHLLFQPQLSVCYKLGRR